MKGILRIEGKWARHTIAVLACGLVLQLLGSYAVGLWGAHVGASKWLTASLATQISLADDPVQRGIELGAATMADSEALAAAERGGPAAIDALLRQRFAAAGDAAFWAWLPADAEMAVTSDARCAAAAMDARDALRVGEQRVLRCDGTAVLAARTPARPELVVGYLLDRSFAHRLHRLTNAEAIVFVDGLAVSSTLADGELSFTREHLPSFEDGSEIAFGEVTLALPDYPGFVVGDGSEPLQIAPGATWYAGVRRFEREGLMVALLVPRDFMTLGAFYNTIFMIPVSLALLALIGLIVWRLVARFSKPISALVGSAHAVTEGDLDHPVEVPDAPEMRELCQTYNAMLERLRETLGLRQQLAREVGRSEVATGVLHNVGNVLNGINVSVGLAAEALRGSKVPNLAKAVAMLVEHAHDLDAFLRDDPRGRMLLPYLEKLSAQLVVERDRLLGEIESLTTGVDHIKNVVRTQQAYAKTGGLVERCRVADLVDDALRLESTSLQNHGIEVDRSDVGGEHVAVDKHKTLQILVNLVTNAKQAIDRLGRGAGRIGVRTALDGERMRIEVTDDGVGISEENLGKIFRYGFTTSRDGHGFGLHNSANAANEMGGSLRCRSDGPGTGATFTLELPIAIADAEAA